MFADVSKEVVQEHVRLGASRGVGRAGQLGVPHRALLLHLCRVAETVRRRRLAGSRHRLPWPLAPDSLCSGGYLQTVAAAAIVLWSLHQLGAEFRPDMICACVFRQKTEQTVDFRGEMRSLLLIMHDNTRSVSGVVRC